MYGLTKPVEAVKRCRGLTKFDMVHNDATPEMEVDSETFEVKADGKVLMCDPITEVPMGQRFFLF